MKWVLIVVGSLVGLVALAAIIGLFLPKGHVARHEIRLSQPPDTVWAVITDFAKQPEWFTTVTSSERTADINGHPAWRENFGGFTADMETAEWDPPRRLRRVVHSTSAGFRGSWTWELAPDDAGTRLAITEAGEVDNPIFRLMTALMDQSATARKYGEALRRRLDAGTAGAEARRQ
jgi:uncharacterized protein YndB with AHSA1/START domain